MKFFLEGEREEGLRAFTLLCVTFDSLSLSIPAGPGAPNSAGPDRARDPAAAGSPPPGNEGMDKALLAPLLRLLLFAAGPLPRRVFVCVMDGEEGGGGGGGGRGTDLDLILCNSSAISASVGAVITFRDAEDAAGGAAAGAAAAAAAAAGAGWVA